MAVKRQIALTLKAKGYKAGFPQWKAPSQVTEQAHHHHQKTTSKMHHTDRDEEFMASDRLIAHLQKIFHLLKRYHPKACHVCEASSNEDSSSLDAHLHSLEDDLKELTAKYLDQIKEYERVTNSTSESDVKRKQILTRRLRVFVQEMEQKVIFMPVVRDPWLTFIQTDEIAHNHMTRQSAVPVS